ncbi:MAG: ATPase [Halanaerobium sp.]|uniref:Dynein-related subfamily AAA family protein n=1 Tax=Halanaerobium saccharolyticum TaxID=43595 RepID=A0A4V3D014_9FIRM|nr:AAA family ATPase [Halanaerobium saccharolyticum]PUU87672.1 MAG: ATPase [Halanaerobium sp.]TDQ04045.1 dynein-related subfamily AAA family protein [Halanaerobium saccharolyticum]
MARYSNCPQSYEVFSEFMDRCLLKDQSLIWSDNNAWTLENLRKIKTNFIDNSIDGGEFWSKLFKQFSELNDDCWRVLADAFFIYTLPSTYMKPEKKYEYISKVTEKRNLELPDFDNYRWDALNEGFSRTAVQYHQKYKQLWLLIRFAISVKEQQNRELFLNDHLAVRDKLFDLVKNTNSTDRSYGMLNAILHLGYPEKYERALNLGHKHKIVDYYSNKIDKDFNKEMNIDQKIKIIRETLEKDYQEKEFDFYFPQIKEQWLNNSGNGSNGNGETEEDPFLDELVKTLRNKKQIILYGPPGTGKTYYAQKLAKTIIAQDNFEKDYVQLDEKEKKTLNLELSDNRNINYLRFCTFHPAYGYEEFMEGYRPALSEDGQAVFELQDGIFKKICNDARDNPEQTYVLIIDEINRGDIPRIFGELITLLEADKRWSENNESEAITLTLPASQENFAVPKNVNIIATMNTADKSIALLDIALRRRFGFRELLPKPELLENQTIAEINLAELLNHLNNKITEKIDKNLQIGHSYFMKKEKAIKKEEQLISRMKDEILPLLQEYCFDDFNTLAEILGSNLVNLEQGRFNKEVFSFAGKEVILTSLKSMLNGENDNG